MSNVIQNAVFVPGTGYLRSVHHHDYITFEAQGDSFMIDGGNEYLRRNFISDIDLGFVDYALTTDSTLDEIYNKLLWGTYGKSGKGPLKWLPICELETNHLYAILGNVPITKLAPCVFDTIRHTLQSRKAWSPDLIGHSV